MAVGILFRQIRIVAQLQDVAVYRFKIFGIHLVKLLHLPRPLCLLDRQKALLLQFFYKKAEIKYRPGSAPARALSAIYFIQALLPGIQTFFQLLSLLPESLINRPLAKIKVVR